MNLDKRSILEFSNQLNDFKFSNKIEACIFPPMTYVDYLNQLVSKLQFQLEDKIVITKILGIQEKFHQNS